MLVDHPPLASPATDGLIAIGEALRLRRKALKISAIAAAEAAGISRVTLHRIEKGEPSVNMGAYMAQALALGLDAHLIPRDGKADAAVEHKGWIPARVRIADYPKLQELAWQLHTATELTPREALGIYERNWRHIDTATLSRNEADLVDALREALGNDTVV